MSDQNASKINRLERELPEGLLVDAGWLDKRGYYPSLRGKYVASGWLVQPTRGVFRRPRGFVTWQQVVVSLQTLLEVPLVVGGRTALELQGVAHYLPQEQREVHLYGQAALPSWINKLGLKEHFVLHNSARLFRNEPSTRGLTSLSLDLKTGKSASNDPLRTGLTSQPWGQWGWPLTLSAVERALFELLDELPERESFHQVDMLMGSLAHLSPRRLQKLLDDCRSVKVKRLFLFFADRHKHSWLKHIERGTVDLGTGKRMLVRGGKLDRTYQITVPGDLDGVQ